MKPLPRCSKKRTAWQFIQEKVKNKRNMDNAKQQENVGMKAWRKIKEKIPEATEIDQSLEELVDVRKQELLSLVEDEGLDM